MTIFYSPRFLRSFQKLPREIQDIYREKETIFRANPFDARLKTHKLGGGNTWAFWVTYRIRVTFVFQGKDIILVNIGDHSIYREK